MGEESGRGPPTTAPCRLEEVAASLTEHCLRLDLAGVKSLSDSGAGPGDPWPLELGLQARPGPGALSDGDEAEPRGSIK